MDRIKKITAWIKRWLRKLVWSEGDNNGGQEVDSGSNKA